MQRILIIGGHGRVALLTAPLLVADGYEVRSVIRRAEQSDRVRATGAEPVVFDVEHHDAQAFAELFTGYDAIVWSAGAGGASAERTEAVDRRAAIKSIDTAASAGPRRYVMVSHFGRLADPEVEPPAWYIPYATAKAAAEEHLRESGLDWTILGPSNLDWNGPDNRGTGCIDVRSGVSGHVSRDNVALVIAQTLRDPTTIGRAYRFNNGEQRIAEALAG